MLTMIIGLILAIKVCAIMDKNHYLGETDIKAVFVGVLIFVSSFILSVLFMNLSDEWTTIERQDIYASGDVFGTEGGRNFVTVEGFFVFYIKEGNGYRLKKLENVDQWTIVEDEENSPYYAIYKKDKNSLFSIVFGFPNIDRKKEIHVPKGSVISEHNYDLSN